MKQSHYLIFDLRRIKYPEVQCVSQLENFFSVKQSIRRMNIIRKNHELIELIKG